MTAEPAAIVTLAALVTFLVGACIGSFLNVVIYRLPLEESIVSPRSRCPGCGRAIPAWENIPVVSYILLRGKCAGCGGAISWRVPGGRTAHRDRVRGDLSDGRLRIPVSA